MDAKEVFKAGLAAGIVGSELHPEPDAIPNEHTPDECEIEPPTPPTVKLGLPGPGPIQFIGAMVFDGPVANPPPSYHPGYLPGLDSAELIPLQVVDLNSFSAAGITPEIVHNRDGVFVTLKSLLPSA